jgi:hypothetical protein
MQSDKALSVLMFSPKLTLAQFIPETTYGQEQALDSFSRRP